MCRIAPSRVMGRMLVAMGRGGCGQARDIGRRARGGRNIMHPGVSPIAVWQRVVGCAHHVDESELGHLFRRLHA